jgi:hypothetical protein
MGGDVLVDVTAPTDLIDPAGHQWAGMLLYAHPDNHNGMGIHGSSGSIYTGTIFAKYAPCAIGGSGDTLGIVAQVICDTIQISGTAAVTIIFEERLNYLLPRLIHLTQ